MANRAIAEADRAYEPGDVILQCPVPLVQSTKYEHRLFTCDCCMRKVDSIILCPVCQKVYYCTRDCQDSHQIHQLECPILSRHKQLQFESNGIDYMQRLTLRLYLLLTTYPELRTKEYRLHNGLTRRIDDMECHPNELKNSAQFQGILNYFKLYKIDSYDYDLLLRAYGTLHVNSFGIDTYHSANEDDDVQIQHCGTGLYIEASVFDHSCTPNACAAGDGLCLEIRALKPIKKGDQIQIDYLQDILPREERINRLSERYFFTCQCVRCTDELQLEQIDYKRFSVLNRLIDSLLAGSPNADVYRFLKERIRCVEQYYREYHPCLSLYYREFLRFLLVTQHQFNQPNQQQPTSNAVVVASTRSQEIEQDLMEFFTKTKQCLAASHGLNHAYSKLFAAIDKQEKAAAI